MASLRELQDERDRASSWYGVATTALEVLIFRRMLARMLESAVGRVLEVAAGLARIGIIIRLALTS